MSDIYSPNGNGTEKRSTILSDSFNWIVAFWSEPAIHHISSHIPNFALSPCHPLVFIKTERQHTKLARNHHLLPTFYFSCSAFFQLKYCFPDKPVIIISSSLTKVHPTAAATHLHLLNQVSMQNEW